MGQDNQGRMAEELLLDRVARLEVAMVAFERRAYPMLTGHYGHKLIAGEILSISTNIRTPAKDGDVGYNLVSNEDVVVPTDDVINIHTGVKIKLPDGYWGLITARSSAVFKHHILVLQGVIDNGYTGQLMVACTALTKQRILPKGTSIAQLILFPCITPTIQLVDELPTTDRGESGFGSTGT